MRWELRIEHPQALIDEMQYHSKERNPNLPASSYSLTCQIDQRGVYSFVCVRVEL